MDIDLNVKSHCMEGEQRLVYYNNSPDVINKVYYHLFFNAFQPNSMMDVRSRTIVDPDPRVGDRIYDLDKKEIGYHKIRSLKQDGKSLEFEIEGTILIANLHTPLAPDSKTILEMEFDSQVPVQIRRSGRDNREGISYSMSQWYPKLCEYDEDGWHPNPYIGREFYGVWGDFDVTIELDKDYMVAAGGVLQNDPSVQKGSKREWHFKAENVHDFMWAADPDYKKLTYQRDDGVELQFFYQPGERTDKWENLPTVMDKAMDFINEKYGRYPYPMYAFIQGGDGGMEYPMGTLITGERSFVSLVSVSVHELLHSWYQMILGTNEPLYSWMDEGFTNWAQADVMNYLKAEGLIPGFRPLDNPHSSAITGYRNFAKTPIEEPMITHADHFERNQAYNISSYVKGAVFIRQLGYIVGDKVRDQVMLDYFNQWAFRHPDVDDFIRIAERRSDMVLDWYKEHFVNLTSLIDYGIDTVYSEGRKKTTIKLSKKERMMMPLDIVVTTKEGRTHMYNIPLRLMRGAKQDEGLADSYEVTADWPWTNPDYELTIDIRYDEIEKVEIDPSNRLADIDLTNNVWDSE